MICVKYTTSDGGNLELQNLQDRLLGARQKPSQLCLHPNLIDLRLDSLWNKIVQKNELLSKSFYIII